MLVDFCLDSSKTASGHVQFVHTPSRQEVFLYICIALRNTAVWWEGGSSQNSPNEASDSVESLAKNIQNNSYKTMKS